MPAHYTPQMIQHSPVSHNAHLPLGLWSCRYGGAVGVTSPEFGADNSGDRSSIPSEAILGRSARKNSSSVSGEWWWAPSAGLERGTETELQAGQWRGGVKDVSGRMRNHCRTGWDLPPLCSYCHRGKDPWNQWTTYTLTLLQLEQTTDLSGQRGTGPPTEPGFSQGFFSILSPMEFSFLAAVASGLLSWGHFISSTIIDLIAQILFKLN